MFRPAFNAPMLRGDVRLDFESKDADGKFVAPEADLKNFSAYYHQPEECDGRTESVQCHRDTSSSAWSFWHDWRRQDNSFDRTRT